MLSRGPRRVLLCGLVVALIAGMTGAAFLLDEPEVVAGEAELAPSSRDVSGAPDTKVVTGRKNQTQLTIPVTWDEADDSWRAEDGVIHVGNMERAEELLIYRFDKHEFVPFPQFHRRATALTREKTGTVPVEPPRKHRIGGLPAVQYRLAGEPDAYAKRWYVYVNGRKAYYLLMARGMNDRTFMMQRIVDSFREISQGT